MHRGSSVAPERRYLAPDDLALRVPGEVPVPAGTQRRHQEQAAPSLFLRVGCAAFAEMVRGRGLRVGIPDFDQDTRAVARQPQADGCLLLFGRGLKRVNRELKQLRVQLAALEERRSALVAELGEQ